MAENICDVLERCAAVNHRGGGGVAQRVDAPVDNPRAYQDGPHGIANVIVAALSRKRRPSRLKHANGVRALMAQMCHDGAPDVVGERQIAISVRLRAADVQHAIPPVNITHRQIGRLLAP
jgi:hypothetical protein